MFAVQLGFVESFSKRGSCRWEGVSRLLSPSALAAFIVLRKAAIAQFVRTVNEPRCWAYPMRQLAF